MKLNDLSRLRGFSRFGGPLRFERPRSVPSVPILKAPLGKLESLMIEKKRVKKIPYLAYLPMFVT